MESVAKGGDSRKKLGRYYEWDNVDGKRYARLRKMGRPMNDSPEKLNAEKKDKKPRRERVPRKLWQRLMELWLLAVLLTFFFIRVLGSHSALRLHEVLRQVHHS